jgi:hypothetical protein
MNPLDTTNALFRKALSTESLEEARTSALTGVKLMAKEGLVLISEAELKALRKAAAKPPTAGASPGVWRSRQREKPATAPSVTGYDSECRFCGAFLPKGSRVFWSKAFDLMVCPDCYEQEILVKRRMETMWEKEKAK